MGREARPDWLVRAKRGFSYVNARIGFRAGEPAARRSERRGRWLERSESSAVLEPRRESIEGVRPSRTLALPRFAFVLSRAWPRMQLRVG